MGFGVSRRFWRASEAWFSSHVAAQAKARGEGVNVKGARAKETVWRTKGSKYLGKHRSPKNALIRVDTALQERLIAPIERIAPALSDAYDKHLGKLAFSAWRRWPVYTGLSKSLLALEYALEAGGDRFVGSVRSRAPYTFFIGTKPWSKFKGQPHRILIDKPSRLVVDQIAKDAIKDIVRHA